MFSQRWIVALGLLVAGACTTSDEPSTGGASEELSAEQCLTYQSDGKVEICHATGSRNNQFVQVRVATAACVNAHSQHARDFVLIGGTCAGPTCLPEGAPCDATLPCCDGLSCSAGVCTAPPGCPAGESMCDGACVDILSDSDNCGACNNACPPVAHGTATCEEATCGFACDAGFHADGGECLDDHDPTSCGPSGTPCATPPGSIATCDGTSCGSVCAAGFSDCDGDPANGCEVDLTSDAGNCGACGTICCTTCGGGTCSTAPVTIASQPGGQPIGITVDDHDVYWTTLGDGGTASGAVWKMPKSALDTSVAPTQLTAGRNRPQVVVVDGSSAYWVDSDLGCQGTVNKIALGGGAVTTLASNQCTPDGIAVDATSVYWPDTGLGDVRKTALAGGPSTLIYNGGQTLGMAIDAGGVNVIDTNPPRTARRIAFDGSSQSTVASNLGSPRFIASDGAFVYVTDSQAAPAGRIIKAAVDGSGQTDLVTGINLPFGITTDGVNVYWSERAVAGPGSLWRVPVGGGTPAALYTGDRPNRIALDASCAYFTSSLGGTVLKVQK